MRILSAALVLALVTLPVMAAGPSVLPAPGIRGGRAGRGAAPAPAWSDTESVFTGTLDQAIAGPVGMSMPPTRTFTLHFTVDQVLRGTAKKGDKISASQVLVQEAVPVFQTGRTYLVGANMPQDTLSVIRLELATDAGIKTAQQQCSVPLGWKLNGDAADSPWAALGNKAWAADAGTLDAKVLCKTTGRPALFAGSVQFTVDKVQPKAEIEYTNPDGDGEYKITVTNPTDKPMLVPALLKQGDKILWEESLLILCQDKAYTCPGATGVKGKVESVTLKPGEKLSTVVNALRLEGPEWPQGGYRIEFRFALGEKSQTMSFYYMSRYHDPIRDGLKAAP